MKTLMLVVVIGQLLFIISAAYQFGDIISFKRFECGCLSVTIYKHYAVYVGDEQFDGKLPGQDIFHFTGNLGNIACVFGNLEQTGEGELDNYLDGQLTPGTPDEMRQRIREKIQQCGKYGPVSNNCEHLASYVRYGEAKSQQRGTLAKVVLECFSPRHRRDANKITLPIEAEFTSCDKLCSIKGKKPGKSRRSLRASG